MKIALVDDEQKYLDEMTQLVRNFGTQLPIPVRNRLKIEQAARNYIFRKIQKHQSHFARRSASDNIRKED